MRADASPSSASPLAATIDGQLRELVLAENYPCVAAVQAITRNDYLVGIYRRLGFGDCWQELRSDLTSYLRQQKATKSLYRTMFAVFPETNGQNEEEFEAALWRELSMLSSEEQRANDWAPDACSDPSDKGFAFSLDGEALFVVGVHAASSRRGRRFPFTGLIFNAFSQFELLERKGGYAKMAALNRQRDLAFDGSVNPMVALHGDAWEAIQFSGRTNPNEWKCPFRFMREGEKK